MKRKLFLLCTLCLALALCALLSSCNLFGDKNQDMGELDFMPTDDGGGQQHQGVLEHDFYFFTNAMARMCSNVFKGN